RRPPRQGDVPNLGGPERDPTKGAIEVGVEAGTRLQVEAARTVGTVGGLIAGSAEVPWAEQPEAGGRAGGLLLHGLGGRWQPALQLHIWWLFLGNVVPPGGGSGGVEACA